MVLIVGPALNTRSARCFFRCKKGVNPNSFIEFFTKTRLPLNCGIRSKRGWHLGVSDGACKKKFIKSLNVFSSSALDRCAPYNHLRDHRWLRISRLDARSTPIVK